jgi:hypothetical protein
MHDDAVVLERLGGDANYLRAAAGCGVAAAECALWPISAVEDDARRRHLPRGRRARGAQHRARIRIAQRDCGAVARSNSGVVSARGKRRVAFRGVSSLVATCEALLVDHFALRVKKLDFAD